MHMKRVRHVVCIQDVYAQAFARFRVNDGAGNAAIEHRLVDVVCDQRRGIRRGISRVEVFVIDQRVDAA